MRFRNRVALITGAGSGIGRATALAFAREGAKVACADLDPKAAAATAALIQKKKGAAVALAADVSRAADCERLVNDTRRAFGRIDILVNNAGIGFTGTVLTNTEAQWNRMMDVNVKGTYLLSRAALPDMIRRRSGSIINLGSIAGHVGLKERAGYCASKGAIHALTKAMALDHVKDGVRVNAVAPGTTHTPWIDKRLAEAKDPKKALADLVARQPMGRLGRPEEMAAAILYLASDEAAFATGSIVTVDGGMTAG
jgi:NAD(P)-dependent dehydrogenase (short-subunit alcohol dehydrogenase family)